MKTRGRQVEKGQVKNCSFFAVAKCKTQLSEREMHRDFLVKTSVKVASGLKSSCHQHFIVKLL